jgi:hypothetical protein
LDAVVTDYFVMLNAELEGRDYVKAEHRERLVEQTGRTRGSIELRHQNISAVLKEMGLPWIHGYKPMRHYSGALRSAIERHASAHEGTMLRPA